VIVSDGSRDGTDDLVRKYAAGHDWIRLATLHERAVRNFASKAHAVAVGYAAVRDLPFDLVGSMDADISFGSGFFGFLVDKFGESPRLGIAGTAFVEEGRTYDYRFASLEHVSGQCQLFRQECFEAIGGYLPSPCGGIDVMAVLGARMKGWQTRTFLEQTFIHHRKMGTAETSPFRANLNRGKKDYLLGGHPLWQMLRCMYQMRRPPFLIGGFLLLVGYASCWLRRTERPMPPAMVRFRRQDQIKRLKRIVARLVGLRSAECPD
jgi:poly-beta-1,6-N-acetyl-D-glucosamine synthase